MRYSFAIVALMLGTSIGLAADPPQGFAVRKAGPVTDAQQIYADIVFLHNGLSATSIEDSVKIKAEAIVAAAETAAHDLKDAKAKTPADGDKIDKQAVELRRKFDKDIAALLKEEQINDWGQRTKFEFTRELCFPNDKGLLDTVADGGAGLDLTDKQQAELKPFFDAADKAASEVFQSGDADREAKRDAAIKASRALQKKVQTALTPDQLKKYEAWVKTQIKSMLNG
jgi:hypothetical protein